MESCSIPPASAIDRTATHWAHAHSVESNADIIIDLNNGSGNRGWPLAVENCMQHTEAWVLSIEFRRDMSSDSVEFTPIVLLVKNSHDEAGTLQRV